MKAALKKMTQMLAQSVMHLYLEFYLEMFANALMVN